MSKEYNAENMLKWRLTKHIGGDFFVRTREIQDSIMTMEIWGLLGDMPKFIDDVQINLENYEILKDFSREKIEQFKAERYRLGEEKKWIYDQAIVDLIDDFWARNLYLAPEIVRDLREKYLSHAVKNIVTKQEWWLWSRYKSEIDMVSIVKSDTLRRYTLEHALDIGEEQAIVLLATGICVLRETRPSSIILGNAIEGYETVMTEIYRIFNLQTDEFRRDLLKLNRDIIDVLYMKHVPQKSAYTAVYGLISRVGRAMIADKFRPYLHRYSLKDWM